MNIADKLRKDGLCKADFTKEFLMDYLVKRIKDCGSAFFLIGKHISTNLEDQRIGDCNPYNRQLLVKWLGEEGFNYEFGCNSYGVEHIRIYL